MKLIILSGPSGSGKSTLSKSWTIPGFKRIEFDEFYFGAKTDRKSRIMHLKKYIFPEIQAVLEANEGVLLDGYAYTWDEGATELSKYLKPSVEIEHWLLVVPVEIGVNRYINKNPDSKYGVEDLVNYYKWSMDDAHRYDFNTWKFVDGTSSELKFLVIKNKEELMGFVNKKASLAEKQSFINSLADLKYDKNYQDIDLGELKFKGTSDSEESWKRIKPLINFKNKSVLELGSFHGYFSFKMKEAGAKHVAGIDALGMAVETAKVIAKLKKQPVDFQNLRAEQVDYTVKRDITVVMNMLHYVQNQPEVLKGIFSNTKMVLFEVNGDQLSMIQKAAADAGYALKHDVESHRSTRRILVYSK